MRCAGLLLTMLSLASLLTITACGGEAVTPPVTTTLGTAPATSASAPRVVVEHDRPSVTAEAPAPRRAVVVEAPAPPEPHQVTVTIPSPPSLTISPPGVAVH